MTSVEASTLDDPQLLNGRLREIYDLYRTASMNSKYYGDRLAFWRKWNTRLEIITALGTSGAVAAFAFWQSDAGRVIWGVVAIIAVILNVVKPIIGFSSKIEKYSTLFSRYSDLFTDLERLVSKVYQDKALSDSIMQSFFEAQLRIQWLSTQEDSSQSDKRVLKYYEEVNREIPLERLWIPV